MDISKSELYVDNDDTDQFFKEFFIKYGTIINGTTFNKYTVKFQLRDLKNLNSGSKSEYGYDDVINVAGLTGSIVFPEDLITKLTEYFNSSTEANKAYGRKKVGLIYLHLNGVLDANLDKMDINDNLKNLDGRPLIDIIKEDIDSIRLELGNELKDFYIKYHELKDAKMTFRDIYLMRFQSLAIKEIIRIYKELDTEESMVKMNQAIEDLNVLLNSFRERTKVRRANILVEKYNIMPYKTYTNNVKNFLYDLRDLVGLESNILAKMDQLSNTGLI